MKIIPGLTTAILLIVFSVTGAMAEPLQEGEWQGALVNSLGKRYKLKYNIRYNNEEERKVLKIEMINLDLEPMPDYTYELVDIKYDEEQLSFNIPREHDTRKCVLTRQTESEYTGECKSNKATEGEVSQISLMPLSENE